LTLEQIGPRFTCASLADFQRHVQEKAHLGIDMVLASVERKYVSLGHIIGFDES
jgi:hypothetical protein